MTLLDDLAQGLQLAEVLLAHSVPPVGLGDGAIIGERGERLIGIVPQVEPPFLPSFHRFEHGVVEIRIDTMPRLDIDNHAPPKPLFPRLGPSDAEH
jgi:hypothetical protein